ncbi:MAG: hypothetical protein QM811_01770 [Pirellulales bacterium]
MSQDDKMRVTGQDSTRQDTDVVFSRQFLKALRDGTRLNAA